MKPLLTAVLLLSGCASIGDQPTATLLFNGEAIYPSFAGGIEQVDGVTNPSSNRTIAVRPGRRTITYMCPDVAVLDAHPTVEATFEPGRTYELVCTGAEAAIHLK